MASEKIVLITGARGRQGGAVARELLARGAYRVRAMTRQPEDPGIQELARNGAEIVRADFNDDASLEQVLHGAWGAFSVQDTWSAGVAGEEVQGLRFAELARKNGVQHFVYTSVASADRKTGIPHFDNKSRIEDRVRALGFPSHVIIRPVFFMENLIAPWFLPAIQDGHLAVGIKPTTKLQMIAVNDIGRHGARAFDRAAALSRQEIDIAGDELTMPETARILSRVVGREVTHVQVPIEEVRKASADFASMLEWFDRVGYDVNIGELAAESGVRPIPFSEWAAHASWPTTAKR